MMIKLKGTLPVAATIAVGTLDESTRHLLPPARSSRNDGVLDASIDLKIDDRSGPEHIFVTITYGLRYEHEKWIYNSYKLKFHAVANGDLCCDMVEGQENNLFSVNKSAQAGTFIRYSGDFNVHFFCYAICPEGGKSKLVQRAASVSFKTN